MRTPGSKSREETTVRFEIQERVLPLFWDRSIPVKDAYQWDHWSDVEQFTDDGKPVTFETLQPIVRELARVFETDFRIVRVTTTTTVVCEELDSTLED